MFKSLCFCQHPLTSHLALTALPTPLCPSYPISKNLLLPTCLTSVSAHPLAIFIVYDINDKLTYTQGAITDLEDTVTENESNQQMIKLYLADTCVPSELLLNNGVVDISLIDTPGLNHDSLKTTALFTWQEEINVIIFIVSTENQFTLSAKEFLSNTSNEKVYLFIVMNKYDQIKNKDKCKWLVLEQIKELSQWTYKDAEDLVHFMDLAAALHPFTANPAFDDLKACLWSFVLVKHSKSKLHPVSMYLSNLLSDIELLTAANSIVADLELQHVKEDLEQAHPVLEKMKSGRDELEDGWEAVEEDSGRKASMMLSDALGHVRQGELGVDKLIMPMPSYPGILGIWDYARDVKKALLASLDVAVRLAEDEARVITSSGVEQIKGLGKEHLLEGIEQSRRVFMLR